MTEICSFERRQNQKPNIVQPKVTFHSFSSSPVICEAELFSPHCLTLSKGFSVPNLYFFQLFFPSEGKLSYRPRGGSLFHPHRLYLLIPSSHFVIRICNHRHSRRVLDEPAGKKRKENWANIEMVKKQMNKPTEKNMKDTMSLDTAPFIVYNKITGACANVKSII